MAPTVGLQWNKCAMRTETEGPAGCRLIAAAHIHNGRLVTLGWFDGRSEHQLLGQLSITGRAPADSQPRLRSLSSVIYRATTCVLSQLRRRSRSHSSDLFLSFSRDANHAISDI